MGAIVSGINLILAKFGAVLGWIGRLFVGVFVALSDLFKDMACWVLDQSLKLVATVLGAFDFSALSQWVGAWSGFPAGVVEVLQAIGVSTAFGIVATALGIRFLLQLVPFTRLGS